VGKDRELAVYDDEKADVFLNLLDPADRKGKGGMPALIPDDPAPPVDEDENPPPPPRDPEMAEPELDRPDDRMDDL